jgi:hypothetical protein
VDRRKFLSGMITGVSGAVASVALATPEQVTALAPSQPLRMELLDSPQFPNWAEHDGIAYLFDGQDFYPVGYVTSIGVFHGDVDITSWWEGHVTLVPGLKRGEMTFKSKLGGRK